MSYDNAFPIKFANKKSIAKRTPIHGVGINDSQYIVSAYVDGKKTMCPYYRTWTNMLERGYSEKYKNKQPTYIGVSVCEEWLTFSIFKEWMEKQDWENNALDKDILTPNNKIYSPSNCCFISPQLNNLLNKRNMKNRSYPVGVGLRKDTKKFSAYISIHGVNKTLKSFNTIKEARDCYINAKIEYMKTFKHGVSQEIKAGLDKHIEILRGSV